MFDGPEYVLADSAHKLLEPVIKHTSLTVTVAEPLPPHTCGLSKPYTTRLLDDVPT
jgi:hypothetical protein